MKILLHDFAGHPFPAQLSRELAERGHSVTHAFCGVVTTGRGDLSRRPDDSPTLRFADCGTTRFERYNPIRRVASEIRYGRSIDDLVNAERPDFVLSANTPLLAQAMLWRAARRVGARRVYWLQDFLGRGTRAVLTSRSRLLGGTAGVAFERLERALLRRSDAIVAISDDFVSTLDAAGIRTPRVVVENWAPLDELAVGARRNAWSEANHLVDRPVALYSGTLGLKHDPGHLVRAAEVLRDVADVVVVTEGRGRELLEAARRERGLTNLRLFDFVDYDKLGDVLATADVSLVLLEPDAGTFSVPSKVLSYLAAGRAVVAAIPAENLAARILARSTAGIVVTPGDHDAFAHEVRRLLSDPDAADQMGKAGRRYAEEHFDIRTITDAILSPTYDNDVDKRGHR